jgi:ABC-type branched-subunit amino acid transport system ATPase component
MQAGAVIADATPSAVLADPAVRNAYFGAQNSQSLVPTA